MTTETQSVCPNCGTMPPVAIVIDDYPTSGLSICKGCGQIWSTK